MLFTQAAIAITKARIAEFRLNGTNRTIDPKRRASSATDPYVRYWSYAYNVYYVKWRIDVLTA